MKLMYPALTIFFFMAMSLQGQGPATWSSTETYTHPSLVIDGNGVSYLSVKNVTTAGTPLSNTEYWATLDSLVPPETPTGQENLTTPDISSKPEDIPDGAETGGSASAVKLKGISTNATVTPSALMVAGVTITGGTKKVVFQVQATGTYPASAGYLSDPVLTIVKGQTVIAVVDNWKSGPTTEMDSTYYQTSYLTDLQNSSYAMKGDKESAIILDLPEGSYTALVGSASGTETAPAVVAAFEFESGASVSKLKGISTNATVTPSALMVAGVTITGGTKKVVFQVQATGTYPASAGYLSDPVLTIVKGQTVIAVVDNWKSGPTTEMDSTYYQTSYLTDLQNSSYAMKGDNESAIILDLPEGSYTALVGSASGTETAPAVVAAFDFE